MTSAEAVARAREVLGEGAGVATATPVTRLDGHPSYWLVTIDDSERTLAVAAIGEEGELVGAGRPSVPGTPRRGRCCQGARDRRRPADAPTRLVWFASRASASPLFPLWEVAAAAPAWVAVDGTLFTERPSEGGPG